MKGKVSDLKVYLGKLPENYGELLKVMKKSETTRKSVNHDKWRQTTLIGSFYGAKWLFFLFVRFSNEFSLDQKIIRIIQIIGRLWAEISVSELLK